MTSNSTTSCLPQSEIGTAEHLFDNWFDPIEAGLRDRAREFLQAMLEAELDESLARSRYARRPKRSSGDFEGTAAVIGRLALGSPREKSLVRKCSGLPMGSADISNSVF